MAADRYEQRIHESATHQRCKGEDYQIKLAVELKTKNFMDSEFYLSCLAAGILQDEITKIEQLKSSIRSNKVKSIRSNKVKSIVLIQDKTVSKAIFYDIIGS